MKQPKKLTRDQKECVFAHGMNPKEWMLVKETEFYLYIIHKKTKQQKSIDKFLRAKRI